MFILTNINIANDMVQVFDTSDGTNDVVRLSQLAKQIVSDSIKIYGLGKLDSNVRPDAIPIDSCGIYVCYYDAKKALASYYQKMGYPKEQALRAVGLV